MNRKYKDLIPYEKKLVKKHYNAVIHLCNSQCKNISEFFNTHKDIDFTVCSVCDNIKHTDSSRCKFCIKYGL